MKKILLVLFCSAILVIGCDMFPSLKKKEAEEKRAKEEQFQRTREVEEKQKREWLNQNRNKAENIIKQFVKNQGYGIQSIKYSGGEYFKVRLAHGDPIGYFNFDIITNNTSQTGGLILIMAKVEYDGSNWTVPFFKPYSQ